MAIKMSHSVAKEKYQKHLHTNYGSVVPRFPHPVSLRAQSIERAGASGTGARLRILLGVVGRLGFWGATTRLLLLSSSSSSGAFVGFGTANMFLYRPRFTTSNKLTAPMAGTSENGASNALDMEPSSRYTLNLYLTVFIISVISFYDALDFCIHMVYKHLVILAVMYYILVMLAAIIHNLNMTYSHILNHAEMIYLIIYDYIITMINYLYVIMFI